MPRYGITGGSGSLGSAIIARLIQAGIGPIVTITRDEFKAEQMTSMYQRMGADVRVMVVADGIINTDKLVEVFRGCDTLIHCAALKRISGSVYAAEEMVRTNIHGTLSVVKAATQAEITNVLMISSDKGCAASNLYGGTKFVGECLCVQANGFTYPKGTRISVARWGNVLGSRGSVVPLWRAAKAAGEKLKLTRKDMTRFIITMPQAVDFVMACVFSMRGGETFVPILPSATMWDLAMAIAEDESMIETLNELRPGGEKLAEILLSEEEPLRTVRRQLHGGFSGPVEALTVLPGHRTWSNESYAGTPVDLAMTYRSDQGPFLTVEELRKMLEEVA